MSMYAVTALIITWVTEGLVQTDRLRPARRSGRPVAVVEWQGDCWLPLKLD